MDHVGNSGVVPNIEHTTYWHAYYCHSIHAGSYVCVNVRDFRNAETIEQGKWYVGYITMVDEDTLPSCADLKKVLAELQERLDNGNTRG